jgi:5'-deoxynucleotidase YfbR-like HD superfamily hydrolase
MNFYRKKIIMEQPQQLSLQTCFSAEELKVPLATPEEIELIKNMDIEVKSSDPWIQTYTKQRFTPTNPSANTIKIQDIAHSLSMQCRFNGHCSKFYSVAQHSVLVSYLCNIEDALAGILHDASEAYLSDVSRPLKQSGKMDSYIEYENKLQGMIYETFGLDSKMPSSVKIADDIMLATEAEQLMAPLRNDWVNSQPPAPFMINPLSPALAKEIFLKRFSSLYKF